MSRASREAWARVCAVLLSAPLFCSAHAAAAGADNIRAVWAHASSTHSKAECDAVLDRVQAAHLNCVYWLGFYWGGKCFFRNRFVPMPSSVAAGFDPLDYLIEEGHRRGIEVHLRFVNGENGSNEPGPFFSAHPDWAWVDYEGKRHLWYDYANPEVRAFQTELMVGAVRNYPQLDGVQFDFVRYEDSFGSFSSAAKSGFSAATGAALPQEAGESLPLVAPIKGNPVDAPTTARVYARFGGGPAAIAAATVGSGGVLLLNWHAELGPFPFVSTLVRRAVQSRGIKGGELPLLHLPESDEWHGKYKAAAETMLQRSGYTPRWVGPEALTSSEKTPVLVVPNCYRISHDNLAKLLAYARSGGHVLMVDGPIYAIGDPLCQELVGFSRNPPYLAGMQAIVPLRELPFFEVSVKPEDVNEATYSDIARKWTAYQAGCITDLVRTVHQRAHEVRPNVVVSACTFHRRSSAESLLQYWHEWVRDGIVDYAVTMAYTPDNDSLRQSMREWLATDPTHSRVIPGLGVYDIDDDGQPQRPDQVLTQMRVLREEGGYSSVAFFHLPEITDALARALATGPFAQEIRRR